MKARSLLLASTLCLLAVLAPPARAITNGEPDAGRHPEVGGTVLYYPARNETIVNCTGTLISRTVFLTAAHCVLDMASRRRVTFDEVFDAATSTTWWGTLHVHPLYDPNQPYAHDVAVIVLDKPYTAATPARLPTLDQLGAMRAAGTLDGSTQFTSVGYGFLGYDSGPGGMTPVHGQTRFVATGSFKALDPSQLHLSQVGALGDGGTCNGDSGGPNFVGAGAAETNVVASITATGDTYCMATNDTTRIDTADVRSFLGQYVSLP